MTKNKTIFKSCLIFFMCVVLLLSVGCSNSGHNKKKAYGIKGNLDSGIAATNANYELSWDNELMCILLENKKSGKIWSTTPYEYYSTGETDEDLSSPIYIEYINETSKLSDVSKGYKDSIKNGTVTSKAIKNGVEVCYYFRGPKIAVPVQYTLRDDSLAISVDFTKVYENENKLCSVSIAPFLTSVKNNTDDSYLFVPSGSGAIMYPNENVDGERVYSSDVFSTNASQILPELLNDDTSIRLPVFGVKSGSEALCAIVEGNPQASQINASAGSRVSGYSNAYVTFLARDYDIYETQLSWEFKDVTRVSESIIEYTGTVCYYPLSNDEANYIGMAKCYKEYLKKNDALKADSSDSTFAVNIIGGVSAKELTCGIPHSTTAVTTTFSQANDIIKELNESCEALPSIRLIGFGKDGMSYGEIGGGFEFSDSFGGKKGYNAVNRYCKNNSIPLYSEFELLFFRKSGSGFNTIMDVAKSASLHKVKKFNVNIDLRDYDEDSFYFLLTRDKLKKAAEKLLDMSKKYNISGVSLSSLGSNKYSDYSDLKYSGAKSMIKDSVDIISSFNSKNINVAVSDANAYSAAAADCCFSVPVDAGDYISLDESIPFYQMVFGADKPLFTDGINVSSSFDKQLMLAVRSGTRPAFILIGEYDTRLDSVYYNGLYSSVYSSNKKSIIKCANELSDFYKKINGCSITEYTILNNSVTKTVFSSNITVYANQNAYTVSSPVGDISPYGYKIIDGGK